MKDLGVAGLAAWLPLSWRAPIRSDSTRVDAGTTQVGRTRETMQDIVDSIREVSTMMQQVSLAAEEQRTPDREDVPEHRGGAGVREELLKRSVAQRVQIGFKLCSFRSGVRGLGRVDLVAVGLALKGGNKRAKGEIKGRKVVGKLLQINNNKLTPKTQ